MAVGIGKNILQVQEVVFTANESIVNAGFQFSSPDGMGYYQLGGIQPAIGMGERTDTQISFRLTCF